MAPLVALFVVLLAGAALVYLAFALAESRKIANLEQNGLTVDGKVTSFEIKVGSRGGSVCRASYAYECEGKSYACEQRVKRTHLLAQETQVKVRCLPQDPWTAMLTGADRDDAYRTEMYMKAIALFALAAFLAIASQSIASSTSSSPAVPHHFAPPQSPPSIP